MILQVESSKYVGGAVLFPLPGWLVKCQEMRRCRFPRSIERLVEGNFSAQKIPDNKREKSHFLGGGCTCFFFHPLFGEDSHLDNYFSKRLIPPTSLVATNLGLRKKVEFTKPPWRKSYVSFSGVFPGHPRFNFSIQEGLVSRTGVIKWNLSFFGVGIKLDTKISGT